MNEVHRQAEISAKIDQGWLQYVTGWANTLISVGWLPSEALDELDRVERILPVVARELPEAAERPLTREQYARVIWAAVAEIDATGDLADVRSQPSPRLH